MGKTVCGRCHDAEQMNKGPTYKAEAVKYNGEEQAALRAVNDPKAEHPKVIAKEDEVKAVVEWIMTQK